MKTSFVFLRAINVGGRNVLRMLTRMSLGFEQVAFHVSVALIALLAPIALAQTARPGTRIPVDVHVEKSALAQLVYCNHLASKVYRATTDDERLARLAEASANLSVIPQVWPKERDTILASYFLTADLDLYAHAPRNAIDTMAKALLIAEEKAPLAERRLGAAYLALNDIASAETHFSAAERGTAFEHLPLAEQSKTLGEVASFYKRTGRPAEAARRYRAIAALPGQNALQRALNLLASAKESARANPGKPEAALADLDAFDRAAAAARTYVKTADEQAILTSLEHDATRMRHEHR